MAEFSNARNEDFYKAIQVGQFDELATIPAGLEENLDLVHLFSRLGFYPSSCLEIGAANGRVVSFLREAISETKIYALERTPEFVRNLKDRYRQDPSVEIVDGDLLSCSLPNTELALWMFSGICEFSKGEQKLMVDKISRSTSRALVIDLPVFESVRKLVEESDECVTLKRKDGETLFLHFPSTEDMVGLQCASQFNFLEYYDYKTSTGRERVTYILRKVD